MHSLSRFRLHSVDHLATDHGDKGKQSGTLDVEDKKI